jgi:hypothetical protein
LIIKIEKCGLIFDEMTICAPVMKNLRLRHTEYEVDFTGDEIKYDLCPCPRCQRDTPDSLLRFFAPAFSTMRKGDLQLPAKKGTFTLWRTKQSIFDQVAQHLLDQGRMAYQNGGCVYRMEEGLRCAAGCLISTIRGWSTRSKEAAQ